MLPQKINIILEIQSLVPFSSKPLIFWKRISRNQKEELHLFLLIEGRTEKETQELVKNLWETLSGYTNELVINKNHLSNPESVCEALLKISNELLLTWSRKNKIDNWSELNLIMAVASPSALYFARLGKSRLLLFRNNQIILADENLNTPRSPQFSPPFSELAGGPLKMGDRIMFISGGMVESFSWEEISSLAVPRDTIQAFYNIVRSIGVLAPPQNIAFALGDVVSQNTQDEKIFSILKGKLKETRMGQLNFLEFNPALPCEPLSISTSGIPWKTITKAFIDKVLEVASLIAKVIYSPFKPISRKIGTLSTTRKVILFLSITLFLVFLGLVTRSSKEQVATPSAQIDFKAIYAKAEQLKEEAASALIYQDEEKARKSLAQADELLQQASDSGEWGIKAIKLRQEVSEQLAILDKAQPAKTKNVWTIPENQGNINGLSLEKGGNVLITTNLGAWNITLNGENPQAAKFSKSVNFPSGRNWLLSTNKGDLFVTAADKSFYNINPDSQEISEKKDLGQEIKANINATASFNSSIYLFDPEEVQIKLLDYANGTLKFNRDWLKQDLKAELGNDPLVSIAVDGSIFGVTQKGNLYRLSGGKKTSWDVEKPGSPPEGEKLRLFTRPEDKNLYILDPNKKTIVILEKETGKLKGQAQNAALGGAVDFRVDESKKEIYFVTPTTLFNLKFEI